jgi:CO/xanthine dehydrogenase FAD-binding subunit
VDLNTITAIHPARHRGDLAALSASSAPLAGGSWLFSEPQDHLTSLVDLMAFGWPSLTLLGADAGADAGGLEVASTCTLAELAELPDAYGWPAHPLFRQCCSALLGSFKVWNVATIGGNICAALPAGPMTSLFSALDSTALIWRADGSDERMPVAQFVTGDGTTVLGEGDILRSVIVPRSSLEARTAYRKIALSPLGRSGAVIVGRVDADGSFTLTVSGATVHPEQLRYPAPPSAEELTRGVEEIETWFTDPHGAADWRRAVSALLAREILAELSAAPGEPVPGGSSAGEPVPGGSSARETGAGEGSLR